MNLYIRKININIVRRVTFCVSLNRVLSTEIYHLYKVSTNKNENLCNVTDQVTQLKSDVKHLIITRSDIRIIIRSNY